MKQLVFAITSSLLLMACAGTSGENTTATTATDTPVSAGPTDTAAVNITETDTGFSWNEEGFNSTIDQEAFIADPDQSGPTNVRNSPDGKVIHKLPQNDSYIVNILSQHDGWFEIEYVVAFMSDLELNEESMWLHPSVLKADTRNYGGQKIPVYQYPQENEGYITGYIEGETGVRFTEFYFDFVHVQCQSSDGKALDGWILKEWLCGNPMTTCP